MSKRYRELSLNESAIMNDLKKHFAGQSSPEKSVSNNMSGVSIESSEFDLFKKKISFEEMKHSTIEDFSENADDEMEVDPTSVLMMEMEKQDEITNKDLFKLMSSIYNVGKKTADDIKRIQNNIVTLNIQSTTNTTNIKKLYTNLLNQYDLNFKTLDKVNRRDQKEIDQEIFVSKIKPDMNPTTVVKKICSFYKIPENCIESFKSYKVKNPDKSDKSINLTIKFVDKEDQITFLQGKSTAGTPTYGYILNQPAANSDKTAIRITRHLTWENRQIGYQLNVLSSLKRIYKTRYKNCCYEIMLKEGGTFIPIPSLEHLKLQVDIINPNN